ncbi:response regulator [Candidatus Nitrosocosmicus hydrocola]|uniref:response regulator n=1 Tax=Candidatus Nitrosocosmicus hydrocola TaxID=1826872 RepID=UPI0011E5B2A7|nr:response regulator [Candidatus Nitrosocosmicus hydrocola]
MSTDYLHYIAAVSQINRRKKNGNTERDSPNKNTRSQTNSQKSLNYDEPPHMSGRAVLPKNKKSILIAESNSDILSMLKMFLNTLGYEYDAVSKGDKVLQHLDDNKSNEKKKYDVILLDTHLDNLSGLIVANEIRKRNSHQRIMIMSTTSRDQLPYELIQSAKVNDSDVFTKPFRLSDLLCSIDR